MGMEFLAPLDVLPFPRLVSLLFVVMGFVVLIGVLVFIVIKFQKECGKFWRKMCGPCIKLFQAPEPADGLDVSHVQLTDATFYEKVHPSVNELEYSYEGNENRFGIKLGQVKFGLEYDFEREELRVTIFEAKNLPAADEGGASDPYIRVMLLPDTKRRYETIVLDDTLDPVYDQEFTFKKLPFSELLNRTLCIRALDFDTLPVHDILGETLVPMIDLEMTKPHPELWRILVPGYDPDNPGEFRQSSSDYGDICVAMQYMPATSKLSVYVIECKNLKSVDEGGVSDPFCEVALFHNRKKKKAKKTRYIPQTLNPYYNEEFVFKLDPALIPVTDVRFLVLDHDFFGGADVIGQVSIGCNSYGPQKRHWRDLLLSPHKPIACWHMLRSKPREGEED